MFPKFSFRSVNLLIVLSLMKERQNNINSNGKEEKLLLCKLSCANTGILDQDLIVDLVDNVILNSKQRRSI